MKQKHGRILFQNAGTTNDKNLNSEIETSMGIYRRNTNWTTNDKNLNSEIETGASLGERGAPFFTTNDKNLNSEIETPPGPPEATCCYSAYEW